MDQVLGVGQSLFDAEEIEADHLLLVVARCAGSTLQTRAFICDQGRHAFAQGLEGGSGFEIVGRVGNRDIIAITDLPLVEGSDTDTDENQSGIRKSVDNVASHWDMVLQPAGHPPEPLPSPKRPVDQKRPLFSSIETVVH